MQVNKVALGLHGLNCEGSVPVSKVAATKADFLRRKA